MENKNVNTVSGSKALTSMVWVAVEKFGYSGLYFFSTIILARLLSPEDYGIVGMFAIFISVSQMIVESGLGGALVKKANPTHADYSTIFTFNLAVSVFLYLGLFFASDYIAAFYEKPIFSDVIKVSALTIVFRSFSIIQHVHLLKELRFKKQSAISIGAFACSTITAIILAYLNYGVWALILQQLLYSILYSLGMVLSVKYKPSLMFSVVSFKELYGFGGRVFATSVLQVVYTDIFALLIGKAYDVATTGLYYQARKLVDFPVSIFRALIDGAGFPILAKIEDKQEFYLMSSKVLRGIVTIAFPLLLAIPVLSKSIILIVLGDKWLASAPILTILSLGAITLVLESVSRNIIKSSGRADILLKSEVVKKVIGFTILIITLSISLELLLWGIVISNLLGLIINMIVVSRITTYRIRYQFTDIIPSLLLSVICCFSVYLVGSVLVGSTVLNLGLQIFILLLSYLLLGNILKLREVQLFTRLSLSKMKVIITSSK